MDTTQELNSHIVYVRRAPMFAADQQKGLEDFYADSHRGIGSYFAKGGMRTATGLTITQENLLLPYIINIPKEDRDFRKEVTIWYQNLETKVPAHRTVNGVTKGGKPLEIGLSSSNNQPVSEDNLPLNVEEYLRYQHILGHPQVAPSEEDGKGNKLKLYFIYDPEAISLGNININEQRDKAIAQYLVIKDKPRTVSMYLTLLGIRLDTLKKGEETMKLRELADKTPDKFMEIAADKDKETKYMIEDMINSKILDRVGKNILTADEDGTILGRDIREAVLFLKDTRNSKLLISLKARLQEVWKKTSISVETDEDLQLTETIPAVAEPTTPTPVVDLLLPNAGDTAGGLGDVE